TAGAVPARALGQPDESAGGRLPRKDLENPVEPPVNMGWTRRTGFPGWLACSVRRCGAGGGWLVIRSREKSLGLSGCPGDSAISFPSQMGKRGNIRGFPRGGTTLSCEASRSWVTDRKSAHIGRPQGE